MRARLDAGFLADFPMCRLAIPGLIKAAKSPVTTNELARQLNRVPDVVEKYCDLLSDGGHLAYVRAKSGEWGWIIPSKAADDLAAQ